MEEETLLEDELCELELPCVETELLEDELGKFELPCAETELPDQQDEPLKLKNEEPLLKKLELIVFVLS
ncbi:MAG: hypothetical protein LBJ67_04390 [Planctomycetaceae bacterium]|nr:hypothetical protein [Planctomycetaceae bacterium]